jgi:TRAP-type C4-dicarboxylate transport system substrate-binding protein
LEEEEVMPEFRTLALAGLVAGALSAPVHAQTTLTMSSWVGPTHHLTNVVLQGFGDEIEKASGGRLKFQMLPKHPAAAPGTFDAVRDGLVDVSYVTASYTPARHILPLMAELPGAGDTAEVNSVAYSRVFWKSMEKAGEYKGVKMLGVFTHGPGQMFNTKRPIKSLADLQGMKIRTGGGIADAMAKALGTSAFVKPAPESYELLSSGIADGVFFPLESVVSFKLDSLVKYATLFPGGFYSSAFGFFMNEDKWNKLSKADQELITRFGGEYLARRAGKSWDAADRVGLEGLKKANVQIEVPNAALVKDIQAKSQPVIDNWIKDVKEKRSMDGAALLKDFHAELKNVAAGK